MESITLDHARMLTDAHPTTMRIYKQSIQSSSTTTSLASNFILPPGTELYSLSGSRRESLTPEPLASLPETELNGSLSVEALLEEEEEGDVKICGEYLEDVDPDLKALTWNEHEASATYVGQNVWHIPPALTLNYGAGLKKLDLSYNCLQTLAGIEYFNGLEELILDNNLLDDTIRFFYNPCMRTLSINKNKITDLERFLNEISLKLPGLTYLSMLGNSACPDQLSSSEHDENDYRRYRSYVVHRIPHLKFLDSTQVRDQERVDAQKRGHYYRLIRLNSDSQLFEKGRYRTPSDSEVELPLPPSRANGLTPLPHQEADDIQPKGGFGRLRHRYTGKHSEGNRFIKNHEL